MHTSVSTVAEVPLLLRGPCRADQATERAGGPGQGQGSQEQHEEDFPPNRRYLLLTVGVAL